MKKIIKLNTEEATLQEPTDQIEQGKENLRLSKVALENVIDQAEQSKESLCLSETALQNVIEQAEQSKESLRLSKVALENVIEQAEHSKLVNLTTLHDATNLALTDPLTQLPNRILFNDRLEQAILVSNRTNRYGALLFIDLDNFKELNDLHGHKSGDLVLIETALRLKSCIRNIDEVARLGGDEFTVILNNLHTDEDISISKTYNVAEKIRTTMLLPCILDIKKNIQYCCTTSIGVVLFNNTETVLIDLIDLADKAMYEAKSSGGNSIRFIRNNGTFYST